MHIEEKNHKSEKVTKSFEQAYCKAELNQYKTY